MGERTERTSVYANPDGYTFTLEESAVPVRVTKPDGGWQAPDAALVKRSDGSVAPKAAAVEMSFSGGGKETPLARIADRGNALELDWPGTLPAPQLDGTSALYADVLPGVDLRVTATPQSFQPVFVVRTPEAAASSELKKLTFGLRSDGLRVHEGQAGNLAAVDGDGRTVFKAPPAQMWDSAGEAEAASGTQTQLAAAKSMSTAEADSTTVTEPSDPSESAPSGSGLEPGQGDAVARMDVDITKDSLTVVPDAEMLSTTPESAFPLFIDPTVTWGESERTLLRSDGYESYGWGNGSDDTGKGAGKCGTWNGYYCGPGYVQRLYFEFSPASLTGKKVLDATFRVTEPWAFQCDPRWVDLVRTSNISSSTTWSSRPKHLDLMVDRHVSAGRGSLCDPDSPDAPIEFNDNPDESNENLTPTVRDFAAGKFARLTLMIKAHDESDTSAWKRFKNDAVLAVDFVGLPDKPSGVGLVAGNSAVCENSESDPAIVSEPRLTATAQTKPGGEKDAQLRVYFDVDNKKSDGTWADTPAGNGDLRPSTGYVGDNTELNLLWSTLTEGTLYRYRAWVRSYYNDGNSYVAGPSNASTTGWCYFKVDLSAPKAPKITTGTPYKECTPNDCQAGGGPGVKGTFSFSPYTGDSNVVSYQYGLSGMSTWPTVSGATANVSVTPQDAGTHTLWVRAKDNLGRPGAWNAVDFLVAAGAGPVAHYHFGEASGVALDAATGDGKDDLTLSGGAARDSRGRRGLMTHDSTGAALTAPVTDKGLVLDGGTGHAATGAAVLETRSSYTVSAWVRVDPDATGTATVLSQDGGSYSPFYLSYDADGLGDWSLRMLSKTESSYTWNKARAKGPGAKGVWTHVAGTFDAGANKVRLFVNGVLQSETDAGTPWSATGALQIGRVKWAGNNVDHFDGQIDEVAVWQRALTNEEIADEARLLISEKHAGVELIADWSADRGSGTSIPDTTSGYGKSLTLVGGASLDGEAVVLDGVDDAAATMGPVVDDTGSFTVTTLAALDGDKLAGKNVGYTGQVVGQRSADGSAWGFWYELTDKQTVLDEETLEEKTVPIGFWRFGRLNADGTFSAVSSEETALVDGMVRLTGVFNAQKSTISLYLGANPNDDARPFTAKLGSREFAVGTGFTGGAWRHYLPGRVAEVRLWAGAMASSEQVGERVGD
ncbi:laminin G domain-containing protein [Streptomyces ferrugineus]|uniref:Laminin G domain-containing protein n=1 Tax=Streptomyces ferrugineus TaxID=1413221 RepID=A0A7M2SHV9_9ACTN|nr:LamG domain-containing protein [Streptomyces ferrugineus]QOV35927.1 laminin G domain-containing protein [Streptomyces ferrugineus]